MASKSRKKSPVTEIPSEQPKPVEQPVSPLLEAFMSGLQKAGFDPVKESGVVYVRLEKPDVKTINETFARMQEIAKDAGYEGSFGASTSK